MSTFTELSLLFICTEETPTVYL